jgi:hypothetical protein
MGRTSDLHAGQWNTPSGSLRISGWPHSQGWAPRASGNPTMSRRISSAEPSRGKAQEPHRVKLGPKETISPDSQNGQRMKCCLDAVRNGTLIAVSFVGRRSVAGMLSCGFVPLEMEDHREDEAHPATGHPVSRDLQRPLDVRGSNLHPAAEASLADLDGHAYHFGAPLFFASPLQLPERATTPGAGSFYQERYREIGWSGIGRKEDQGEEIHRRSERRHKITQRGFRFPSVVSLCRGRLEPDQPP